MVELEIDHKKISVPEGTTIIEAADRLGVYIPRFCYHKKLSIAANCRMCLVEVEKVGKPLPACATPVTPGMKVYTTSKKALAAQRAVMEFLLINHPLDCPICDQGGECELQDLSLGFGRGYSEYEEPKRAVFSEDVGPLIETEMTRCIHCTRCVRFGAEIAGLREMGATGRGGEMEIGTYVQHFLQSEVSGNIIDLCPVGALTNKPARYQGRSWEYREHPAISPHDCVGSHLFVHSRGRQLIPQRHVMRAVPRENELINETWLSDRDRFGVHGIYDKSRAYHPQMKKQGKWVTVEWERALAEIADRVRAIVSQQGAEQIAGLAMANSTTEELYLLQKMIRGLGSDNVDHRLRQQDFRDQDAMPQYPNLGMAIADIETLDSVLLVGSHIRFEQPMINLRLRKACSEQATAMVINPVDYEMTVPVAHKIITPQGHLVHTVAQVTKAVLQHHQQSLDELSDIAISEPAQAIADQLASGKHTAIFIGEHVLNHADAAQLRSLLQMIAKLCHCQVSELTAGPNAAGAWLAGCVPHRAPGGEAIKLKGLHAQALLTDQPRRGYFLLNCELESDSAYPAAAIKALRDAGLVVCLTPFVSESMLDYADFILPVAPFTETAGTYVNVEGHWQAMSAASLPHQDCKPAWKVLRVLANFLELADFEYRTVHEVQAELHQQVKNLDDESLSHTDYRLQAIMNDENLMRLAPWPAYRVDPLVRRSEPLQACLHEHAVGAAINTKTAERLNLMHCQRVVAMQGESRVSLPLILDDRLADNTVLIPSGAEVTCGFGQAESPLTLQREN